MIKVLQIFWGIGIAAWNAYGMVQLQQGGAPPGPTSSWLVAGFGLVIAFIFGKDVILDKWLYSLFSLFCCVLGFVAVYGAFTKDPSLWPSEGWRWAGIILNGIGFIACLAGIITSLNNQDKTT